MRDIGVYIMTPWNQFNQCMAIAARCNQAFCKLFRIQVSNNRSLWIDLYPLNGSHKDNIHMVSERNSNKLEVYFNFSSRNCPFTDDDLNYIAYKLGMGILNQYVVVDSGVVFILDESLDYPLYEDTFSFISKDMDEKTITTDFPLLHHLHTELEVGTSISCETNEIIRPNTAIIKNGIPMFDIQKFNQLQNTLIVKIIKIDGSIKVELDNNNFMENATNLFNGLSLMSTLSFYGNEKESDENGLTQIYLSASAENGIENIVRIHRFDNTLLSKREIEETMPKIQDALGFSASFNVNTYWGL